MLPIAKAKIIISVTSDLVTDQRVHKVATSLHNAGYEVLVFGRKKRNSTTLTPRIYQTKRTFLLFEKGFLFYATYNTRLFFFLLFSKFDMLLANDLDTLLPNYAIAKLFHKKLIYDTHEYFTGVPELQNRPKVRKIWKSLENYLLPKLTTIYTVNHSISKLYADEYGIKLGVVRNLPITTFIHQPYEYANIIPVQNSEKAIVLNLIFEALKLEKRKIIIYQGAINQDRGLEEMVAAMEWVQNACLLIIGSGDIEKKLKLQIKESQFPEKICMIGQVPFQYLPIFTALATLGLSVEKSTNINYKFASPNKVIDYIHAGVPVLATKLVEIEKILNSYQTGTFLESHNPATIALQINTIVQNEAQLTTWKQNCAKAAAELRWENEEKILLSLINKV